MAKKQRFRDTKQQRATVTNKIEKPAIPFASLGVRVKAFLTDVFMLLMPLFYLTIYLIFDGLEDVASHRAEAWIYIITPFIILLTVFMLKDTGRTPGARSQGLKVIEFHSLEKPSLFSTIFRNITLLFSMFIPLFWLMPFFRKDKRMIHDFLSATCLIVDVTFSQENISKNVSKNVSKNT